MEFPGNFRSSAVRQREDSLSWCKRVPRLIASCAGIAAAIAVMFFSAQANASDIFNNTNAQAVTNCPASGNSCFPSFTLAMPTFIDQIETYHWNGGKGDTADSIELRSASGQTIGPFQAKGYPATGGVLANWAATLNQTLPAGTYTIIDNHVSTWSENAQSKHQGFAIVSGGAPSAPVPTIAPGAPAMPAPAPKPSNCSLRSGFQFLCYGDVITVTPDPVMLGGMMKLTVNPTSGYSFDANTVIVLEPAGGVGFGVGLRTLCGGLSGGAAAPPCPLTGPKSMTIAVPGSGSIPVGSYLLSAENWNPSIVVGGVGVCTPTCTDAEAGIVKFTNTAAGTGSLKITSVSYPVSNGQIGVGFIDSNKDLNQVQVRPWLGYQWGQPNTWNPGAAGMSAGELFISVGGCSPGQQYTIWVTLADASGQSASQQFTYKCM